MNNALQLPVKKLPVASETICSDVEATGGLPCTNWKDKWTTMRLRYCNANNSLAEVENLQPGTGFEALFCKL